MPQIYSMTNAGLQDQAKNFGSHYHNLPFTQTFDFEQGQHHKVAAWNCCSSLELACCQQWLQQTSKKPGFNLCFKFPVWQTLTSQRRRDMEVQFAVQCGFGRHSNLNCAAWPMRLNCRPCHPDICICITLFVQTFKLKDHYSYQACQVVFKSILLQIIIESDVMNQIKWVLAILPCWKQREFQHIELAVGALAHYCWPKWPLNEFW